MEQSPKQSPAPVVGQTIKLIYEDGSAKTVTLPSLCYDGFPTRYAKYPVAVELSPAEAGEVEPVAWRWRRSNHNPEMEWQAATRLPTFVRHVKDEQGPHQWEFEPLYSATTIASLQAEVSELRAAVGGVAVSDPAARLFDDYADEIDPAGRIEAALSPEAKTGERS